MLNIGTHNGTITLENSRTGAHRTLRVHAVKFQDGTKHRVLQLLTGHDNTNSYQSFAFVNEAGEVKLWKRFKDGAHAKLAALVSNPRKLAATPHLHTHCAARCRICNRKLTTPESIKSGIGPICASR